MSRPSKQEEQAMSAEVATLSHEQKPATGEVQNIGTAALNILQNALLQPDIPAERIDKALEWMERLEAKAAAEAFNRSLAAVQAEMPIVPMNGSGHNRTRYATLADIIQVTRPVLAKHGMSVRFDMATGEGNVTVTAILHHTDGHSERVTGVYPYDASGSKNAIQSMGSAQTYGQRYTISALLNIATGDAEDDGQQSGKTITDEQVSEIAGLMAEAGTDQQKFLTWAGVERLKDLPSTKFGTAQAMLQKAVRTAVQKGGEA